jgi:ribulose-5-phosphate 4-epimerase/fuculose-1-phosphate aldolase
MLHFQTFYVSKEESNCPLIADALRVRKKIIDLDFKDVIISQRYGKRILINSNNFNEEVIKVYFLEIVDYDPIKNILLVMGPNDPRIETPLHWFIHHARNEVNAVVQINDEELSDKLKDTPKTQKDYSVVALEQIKEVLKNLKDSKKVIIKNQGVIFVGNNIKDVEKQISEVIK